MMILQAATALLLLLLLMLQTATVGARDWKANCTKTKACWVSAECALRPLRTRDPMKFYLTEKDAQFAELDPNCKKYLTVEPNEDEVVFEIMHEDIGKDDEVKLAFRSTVDTSKHFTCQKQQVTSSDSAFKIFPESEPGIAHFFCRFIVRERSRNPNSNQAFYTTFSRTFETQGLQIQFVREGQNYPMDDYNEVHFKGRVPCSQTIFLDDQLTPEDHILKAKHDFLSRAYNCPANYTMSRKLYDNFDKNIPEKDFAVTRTPIKCNWGKIEEDQEKRVSSAKCHRKRYTLCDEVCKEGNCTGLRNSMDNEMKRSVMCDQKFMIINNGLHVSKKAAECSAESKPDQHMWKVEGLKKAVTTEITDVQCSNELDCNTIYPFGDLECANCSKAIVTKDGVECENGAELVIVDGSSSTRRKVSITCERSSGRWKIDGKYQSESRDDINKIKMGCVGGNKKKEKDEKPAAASSGNLVYIAISIAAVLLLLLLLLLLYFFCCRKARKEEPKPEPSLPPPTRTDSSVVEMPASNPEPIAPAESEPEQPPQPWQYSGQRVQFINMSKEKLREIEPEGDPTMEFSARDKTLSDRSKASQVGQPTTEGGPPTFTGTRATEKTNEVSRTLAPGEESRSDASNGRDSTVGAGTPTNGNPATKKGTGAKVSFRERVSYETDTKTRDRSSFASMHTAPEQQQTKIDPTQKDDPSRQTAEAQKAFGRERTRTTQATRETNEDANRSQDSVVGNRSKSNVTDNSRTG